MLVRRDPVDLRAPGARLTVVTGEPSEPKSTVNSSQNTDRGSSSQFWASGMLALEGRERRALEGFLSDEEDPAGQMLGIAVWIRATDRELIAFVRCRDLML